MVVVERTVAAMDAHRGEVAAVKSGLGFLWSMSFMDDKVWGVCGAMKRSWIVMRAREVRAGKCERLWIIGPCGGGSWCV
jgi:hypothetical protein